ncbi:S8 family serine peptidase [Pseudonocardia sp. KRD-184]|uniref:S8 family serine peptidase n=1 Tax=Pseudonocardia oceani TaxID=2792013 RepID=A0ABS6U4S2_9PSEU|nr:S8 family serine peptidase [Pseudonocardia oceani]MBW0091370.1 S8 family serine peptidase [Pseudonocardia oceani]MBW0098465.1 S8 family serine peptidase [Pseudonocardia oceani]MBW0111031.1 S8 family serine peptidase [Pseudonocardia oceani]MBW0125006.1 S8 family serine peptidase [Pseudonocardia oceani]MBW0127209.1 S8 family serine peptidase [Pseudonocardia oceani]
MQLRTDGPTSWPDQLTGRLVLVLSDDLHADPDAARAALAEMTGAADESSEGGPPVLFPRLGIAVVPIESTDTDAVTAMIADRRIVAAEPERVHHLRGALSEEYLRGFADAAAFLHAQAVDLPVEEAAEPVAEDTDELTWGLQVTRAATVPETGAGISVAILDTGLDLEHPDFAGRDVLAESFVEGETAQDANGHGTHCAGTSCGALLPGTGRRYGVAHEARILAGKVLSDAGSGTDAEILAGMAWAIENGAQVISMSLGADVDEVSAVYETVGRRALAAGVLVIAAAGNNADRASGDPGFVGIPANSPSIMAVAAVDNALAIASFSARSSGVEGGQVDVAAPGVDVYSSWPMPDRYDTISGTSMATPHVAGLAALWAQRTGARGEALWGALVRGAARLPLPSDDVGAGLVQAPPVV